MRGSQAVGSGGRMVHPAKDAGDFLSSLPSQRWHRTYSRHLVLVAEPEDELLYVAFEIHSLIVRILELSVPAIMDGQ